MYNKFLLTVILGSFFIFNFVLAVNTDIVINEIGAYPTSTHEWIEIWNKGSDAVDLTSWKFWEGETNHGLQNTSTTDSVVASGEYAVICQDATQFFLDYPAFNGSVFDSAWGSLSTSSEEIGLKYDNDNFVEKFSYISTTNYSLERKNPFLADYTIDNWQGHINGNTVGAVNSNYSEGSPGGASSTDSGVNFYYWSLLKINEIMPGPAEGNEWVELYNTGTTSLDLVGGFLCDSRGGSVENDSCKNLFGIIEPGEFLLVDLFTRSYLNNDGDSIYLKNPSNAILDEISYGNINLKASEKGQSLARIFNGIDTDNDNDWAITTTPTPSSTNIITAPVVPVSASGGGSSVDINTNNNETKTSVSSTKKITTTAKISAPKDTAKIVWVVDFPYSAAAGEAVEFNARLSSDPRGGQLNFWWNFGGGNTATGSQAVFTFVTSGVYTINIFATSTAGTFGQKEIKILVGDGLSVRNSSVLIGEILTKPDEGELEYIEIFNIGSSIQDISQWILRNKANKEYVLPLNNKILGGQALTFYENVTHLHFDSDGDWLELLSPDEKIVDLVDLPKLISNPPDTVTETEKEKVAKTVSTKTAVAKSVGPLLNSLDMAQNGEKGQPVKVQGMVTALPGVFGVQYFYIFDGQNGMQVYQYKKDFPPLALGDWVEINGEISLSGNIKRIKVFGRKEIDILAVGKNIEPLAVELEELGEEMVGALVKIAGDITEIKTNYMYIDDGNTEAVVYFKKGAQIDKKNFMEGEKVVVTGIVENSKSGLQVWPRFSGDIVKAGVSAELIIKQRELNAGSDKEVAEKYLTATAGGLTTLLLGFLARGRGAVLVGVGRKVLGLAGKIIRRG